ncbi:hypothetical protein [Nocardiopsis sp. NPDC006938]|uniref:hypothetical protein n=1 Tax=Nocardiopsis sp. NPDC006938 TaxID=3364337 RepID=UPI00369C3FD0
MLLSYQLICDAYLDGDEFVVTEKDTRRDLTADQVLNEYGDRLAEMVTTVMKHSTATTTDVSVDVAGGAVPYIEHVNERATEYAKYWPGKQIDHA